MQILNSRYNEIFEAIKYWPRTIKLLFEVKKEYMILILVLSILEGALPVVGVLITQELINTTLICIGKSLKPILYWVALSVIVEIIMLIVECIYGYLQSIFQLILVYKLNIKIMDKSAKLSLSDFENPEIYDALQRAQSEVGSRPFKIFTTMFNIITGIISLISSSLILIRWKWWVFLILILSPIISTYYSIKIGKREFDIQNGRAPMFRKSWYYSFLLTKDVNFKEVKIFNIGNHIVNQYRKIYKRFLRVDKKLSKKKSFIAFSINIVEELIGAAVLLLIIISTFTGEILIGNLISFKSAVTMCISSFKTVFANIASLFEDNLFIKQFFKFIDLEEDKDGVEEGIYKHIKRIEKIEFRNVSFRYPNKKEYALKNVSFSIERGQIIGIVGENGSGKSTLIKLLLKLYKVEEGEILINGENINSYKGDEYRNRISTVFQDFVKYELTLRDNIGFGDIKNLHDKDRILEAINKSGISTFMNLLTKGINTQLGSWFSNSQQLSGGQWQKIAIARAFFRKADIYMLDEPSSVLDPISEKDIFDRFLNVAKDNIGIFTTHRFSTVKFADKIIVFNKGILIESGNHEELMKINGIYKNLYNVQAKPFEEDYKSD